MAKFVVSSVMCTLITNLLFSKSFLERNRVVFGYAQVELSILYPGGTLWALNCLESIYQGNLLVTLVVIYLEAHFALQRFFLEDVIFRDLGVIGGPIHNFRYYIYIVVLFIAWSAMQYLHFG